MPSSTSIAVAFVALAAVVLGTVATAQAQDPAPPPAEAPAAPEAPVRREVIVEIAAADDKDLEALSQVARELLGRLAIDVRAAKVDRLDLAAIAAPPAAPRAGAEPPLARVWIDWRSPGRATLYLLDARHDRLLVRTVERNAIGLSGGDELAREELAHILETACEGLLSGGEVGVPRAGAASLLLPPAPSPAGVVAAPSVPAPVDDRDRISFGVLYEAAALARQAPVTHGPALSAVVRGRRVGFWATAQFRFPVRAASDAAGVELRTIALRALVTHEWLLSPRAALRGGLGGGADLVGARPTSAAPDRVVVEEPRSLRFAVGRAAVALDLRLASHLLFVATVATDVDLTGQRYVYTRASSEQLVLRSWPVRPSVAMGVAFQ